MKDLKACFSHKSDNWRTPSNIYNFLKSVGYIDLFPYCCEYNQFDILYKHKLLFCNPPFSQLNKVIDYLITLYNYYNDILLLIPSRTDTAYFHKLIHSCNCEILFIEGRLKFNDYKCAAFPSLLIHLNKNKRLCDDNKWFVIHRVIDSFWDFVRALASNY